MIILRIILALIWIVVIASAFIGLGPIAGIVALVMAAGFSAMGTNSRRHSELIKSINKEQNLK